MPESERSRIERLSSVAGALADATRLKILLALIEREATVSELVALLGVPQPRVSTHLAVLPRAGLVSFQPSGRRRLYAVDAARVEPILTGPAVRGRRGRTGTRRAARGASSRSTRRCGGRGAAMTTSPASPASSCSTRCWRATGSPRAPARASASSTSCAPTANPASMPAASISRAPSARAAYTPSAARTGPSAGRISGARSGARSRTRWSATASSRARRGRRDITLQRPLVAWLDVPP